MAQQISPSSYSTIFHCSEGLLVCSLRLLEGLISAVMFGLFMQGYYAITREKNNIISIEDKQIFLLGLAQTFLLTLYYLLFQQFFMLATIRNVMIWISINIVAVLCEIYWMDQNQQLSRIKWIIRVLKLINLIMWFVISLGDGSSLVNTSFNLGYNCRLIDWMLLSGTLTIIVMGQAYLSLNILDRLTWEKQNTPSNDARQLNSIEQEKINLSLLIGCSLCSAIMMFIWDYVSYTISTTDEQCAKLFAGSSFFPKILCFLLKILTMQLIPSAIYYTVFYKCRQDFLGTHHTAIDPAKKQMNFLNEDDDIASQLNRTLTSRVSSRKQLLSTHEINAPFL